MADKPFAERLLESLGKHIAIGTAEVDDGVPAIVKVIQDAKKPRETAPKDGA